MKQGLQPITTAPDKIEMSGRLAKVRETMAAQQLDYYISYDPVNVYYLTNFYNYIHEGPFLAEGYDRELEAGMMVSVEPGIYFPGLGGFRHSDTVLITEDGYAKLTNAPDAIEDLTIPL